MGQSTSDTTMDSGRLCTLFHFRGDGGVLRPIRNGLVDCAGGSTLAAWQWGAGDWCVQKSAWQDAQRVQPVRCGHALQFGGPFYEQPYWVEWFLSISMGIWSWFLCQRWRSTDWSGSVKGFWWTAEGQRKSSEWGWEGTGSWSFLQALQFGDTTTYEMLHRAACHVVATTS